VGVCSALLRFFQRLFELTDLFCFEIFFDSSLFFLGWLLLESIEGSCSLVLGNFFGAVHGIYEIGVTHDGVFSLGLT
jgi:hypothetical protein